MRISEPKLIAAIDALGVEYKPGVSLAPKTSLEIGGTSDLLIIHKHESLPGLINLLKQAGVPHRFLGGGSNVLLPDGEHFVCPGCKRRAHLVHDLSIRWNKKPYPVPNKYSLCDRCHRRDVEESDAPVYTNRFSRGR